MTERVFGPNKHNTNQRHSSFCPLCLLRLGIGPVRCCFVSCVCVRRGTYQRLFAVSFNVYPYNASFDALVCCIRGGTKGAAGLWKCHHFLARMTHTQNHNHARVSPTWNVSQQHPGQEDCCALFFPCFVLVLSKATTDPTSNPTHCTATITATLPSASSEVQQGPRPESRPAKNTKEHTSAHVRMYACGLCCCTLFFCVVGWLGNWGC